MGIGFWIWNYSGLLNLDKDEDLANIAVEFHGMLFDVILFGLVLTVYDILRESRHDKKRYNEEITDYLGWKGDEAKFRIVGLIKRINNLGFSPTTLYNSNLKGAKLHKANLQNADLKYSDLRGVNLSKAYLGGTNLSGTILQGADLRGARFPNTIFKDTFYECCDLEGAKVESVTWFEDLGKLEQPPKGLESIKEKYEIDLISQKDNSEKTFYLICKRKK